MTRKSKLYGVRISPSIVKTLQEFAKKTGLKIYWIVEDAIKEYIEKHKIQENK